MIIHSRKWFLFYFLNFPLQILTKFVCSIYLEKQLKHFSFSQLGSKEAKGNLVLGLKLGLGLGLEVMGCKYCHTFVYFK